MRGWRGAVSSQPSGQGQADAREAELKTKEGEQRASLGEGSRRALGSVARGNS